MALIIVKQKEVEVTKITKLSFLQRFTQEERIAIRTSTDPIVVDFLELLSMAQDVDTAYPDTIAGVNYLESTGLVGEGRAAEILKG